MKNITFDATATADQMFTFDADTFRAAFRFLKEVGVVRGRVADLSPETITRKAVAVGTFEVLTAARYVVEYGAFQVG